MSAVAEEVPETVDESPEKVEDLEVILPTEGEITVEGIRAKVRRLKTREFLLLMRVLTNGMGQGITQIRLTLDDPEELKGELLAVIMLAVPNAIEDFGSFLLAIVDPVDPAQTGDLAKVMVNPEPEVLIDVLGLMAEQEKDDLSVLAGKAQAWMKHLGKVYGTATG